MRARARLPRFVLAVAIACVVLAGIRAWGDADRAYVERPLPKLDAIEVARANEIDVPYVTEWLEPPAPSDLPLIVVTKSGIRFDDGAQQPLHVPLVDGFVLGRNRAARYPIAIEPLSAALGARRRPDEDPYARVLAGASTPILTVADVCESLGQAGFNPVLVVRGPAGEGSQKRFVLRGGEYDHGACEEPLVGELVALGASPRVHRAIEDAEDASVTRRKMAEALGMDANVPMQPRALRDRSYRCSPLLALGSEGITVTVLQTNMAPGCARVGEGVAIPNRDRSVDWDGLGTCVRALRSSLPAVAKQSTARLDLSRARDLQEFLRVEDVVRAAGLDADGNYFGPVHMH